jgi:endonuclease-3 related protein
MKPSIAAKSLQDIYRHLLHAYGPQDWWPARTPTEIVVGSILTQNTAWANVKRAIANLRRARALSWKTLRDLSEGELADLIRPSGTYRVKAARLKAFVDALWRDHGGSLESLLDGDLDAARRRLLAIHGVGRETADAILLYVGNRLTFVVDAYTKRILRRHHLIDADAGYESVRELFQASLPADAALFNEYHALLVAVAKKHCRSRATCDGCPLATLTHDPSL